MNSKGRFPSKCGFIVRGFQEIRSKDRGVRVKRGRLRNGKKPQGRLNNLELLTKKHSKCCVEPEEAIKREHACKDPAGHFAKINQRGFGGHVQKIEEKKVGYPAKELIRGSRS